MEVTTAITETVVSASGAAGSTLAGQMVLVVLIAAALAVPVSIVLLSLYRRSVLRSMRAVARPGATDLRIRQAPTPSRGEPDLAALHSSVLEQNAPLPTPPDAERFLSSLASAPWRAAAVYAAAGLCFAAVMTVCFLGTEVQLTPLRLLVVGWNFAWPVVLTVNLVAAATWRARLAVTIAYLLILVLFGIAALAKSSELTAGQLVVLWALLNAPASIVLLAFLGRPIRAVGPLVLTFMVVALAGSSLALTVAASQQSVLAAISALGSSLGLSAPGEFIGIILVGFAVFAVAGWASVRWIGTRYERKSISDQSITLDAIWMFFGVIHSISIVHRGATWLLSGVLAFVAYKSVAALAFFVLRRAGPAAGHKLLLLRAFSVGRRAERLYDAVGMHWRHVGSIQLIAGPDLATTTLEPHEFLDFLRGRLARRFIDGEATLDLRMSELDVAPDRDGRFRVNEFFCYDDAWKACLTRLVNTTDVALMDLRGFSPRHPGVVFEIHELINAMPLERVLFIIDESTDEPFLRQTAQQAWTQLRADSPNRSQASHQLRLLRYTGSRRGELRQLLRAVCAAVNPMPALAAVPH